LTSFSQSPDISKKLKGFDQYMEKILKEWNIAGAGVGIVYKDKLVFAKGYGYRDYENKLPVTPNTLYQIASNTKLFTTIAVGMLVDQGKLDWDKPVKKYVPTIDFFNNDLNNSVTIRDMLAHRTGISRHDMIWYQSDFSRKDIFERIKYLEPSQSLRQGFLYNNLMYVAAGYIVELLSLKTWEDFLRTNIFGPLEMRSTVFTVKDMEANPDHGIPFNERRDTNLLYRIPIYEDKEAVGPAGAIISNIQDMSNWLIALMNDGKHKGRQVIPENVIRASLEPTMAFPNTRLENQGYGEILNTAYGMGRYTASYRGHLLTYHGGSLPGFYSQLSAMPYDSIGVITFVIGAQGSPLADILTYNLYERLLDLSLTPWSDRILSIQKENKKQGKAGRGKAGSDRVPGTSPSHKLIDFTGQYENPAYGEINIIMNDNSLTLDFHRIRLPLNHYHYDRFDTPNDEQFGLYSLNFLTGPQGNIDGFIVSIDQSQTTFTRKIDPGLTDFTNLIKYSGKYGTPGSSFNIELIDKSLYIVNPGQPIYQLIPLKPHIFRIKEFADRSIEFIIDDGNVTAVKQISPSGEYVNKKLQ
jgi:CubicO group peptidase (beta-lactamase class C family)